jgi:hypothetical protein
VGGCAALSCGRGPTEEFKNLRSISRCSGYPGGVLVPHISRSVFSIAELDGVVRLRSGGKIPCQLISSVCPYRVGTALSGWVLIERWSGWASVGSGGRLSGVDVGVMEVEINCVSRLD